MRAYRGLLYVAEWWLRLPWPPPLRASWLRFFGAHVGPGARVHRCHIMNLEAHGFSALRIGALTNIGPECLLDLAESITLGDRVGLGPRVVIITHTDLGASSLRTMIPRTAAAVAVADDASIATSAIIMQGVKVGAGAIVGPAELVLEDVAAGAVMGPHTKRR